MTEPYELQSLVDDKPNKRRLVKPIADPDTRTADWWDAKMKHPLTTAEFTVAALNHYLVTSPDMHVKQARLRVYELLKIICRDQIDHDLLKYRAQHAE